MLLCSAELPPGSFGGNAGPPALLWCKSTSTPAHYLRVLQGIFCTVPCVPIAYRAHRGPLCPALRPTPCPASAAFLQCLLHILFWSVLCRYLRCARQKPLFLSSRTGS